MSGISALTRVALKQLGLDFKESQTLPTKRESTAHSHVFEKFLSPSNWGKFLMAGPAWSWGG